MSYSIKIENIAFTESSFEFKEEPKKVIEYLHDDNLIRKRTDIELVAIGYLFELLLGYYNDSGFCGNLSYTLFRQPCSNDAEVISIGIIKLNDIVFELDTDGCRCTFALVDSVYNIFIQESKSQKIDLLSTFDLACLNIDSVELSDILIGEIDPQTTVIPTIRLFDAINQILISLSSGQVTLKSTYLDVGEGGNYRILNGYMLRTSSTYERPVLSWVDVFEFLKNTRDLWAFFGVENGEFVCRIELLSYFQNTEQINILNPNNLSLSSPDNLTPSIINVGNSKELDRVDDYYKVYFNYTFSPESYNVGNDCKTDFELDLQYSLITDTNIIRDVFLNDNSNFDKEIFVIETDGSETILTEANGVNINNYNFLNFMILQRHYEGSQPSYLFNGEVYDAFSATTSTVQNYGTLIGATPVTLTPVDLRKSFPVSDLDINNTLSTQLFTVTPPWDDIFVGTQQYYTFFKCKNANIYQFEVKVQAFFDDTVGLNFITDCELQMSVLHYDSTLTTLKNTSSTDYKVVNETSKTKFHLLTDALSVDVDDIVYVVFNGKPFDVSGVGIAATTVRLLFADEPLSMFYKTSTCNSVEYDLGENNLIGQIDMTSILVDCEDFDKIESGNISQFKIQTHNKITTAHLNKIEYYLDRQLADFELRTNSQIIDI